MKTIRIGNGAGFWGDNLDAPRLLAESSELDYLTLEYLAELTMSILARQKSRDSQAGFVTDFPDVLESLLPSLQTQRGLRIVTNAGGMNPQTCARRAAAVLAAADLGTVPVAMLTGDDLLPNLEDHLAAGEEFANSETGEPFRAIRDRLVSANAYLGAEGIVEALRQGTRIVITGRVADASLTVAPAVFEFGWNWDDWNSLAAATVAGHLIECGAQVTGGMLSTWTPVQPLAEVGYPIAELSADTKLVITKGEGTDGRVTHETVAEQLVYEIGDPCHYLTPEVDADFSRVHLQSGGDDRVRVSGWAGKPPPGRYKVSMAYHNGYTASGSLVISGRHAEAKARYCAETVFGRLQRAGCQLERTNVECLGAGDVVPGIRPWQTEPGEVVLRISVQDSSRPSVERFCRELTPLVTSGPPGVTGYAGGRPKPRPVLAYWPTSIDRHRLESSVTTAPAKEWIS